MKDPTRRFSTRVENYVRFRPHYPQAVIDTLRRECGLRPDHVVADIGSGTGILTALFIANGNAVHAVEPNPEMRGAAERSLGTAPLFRSVAARAEDTTLPPASVDLIAAGQAFHWFDREAARREFRRILRPRGFVALVWNERASDTTPFLRDYEALLRRWSTDYDEVDHRQVTGEVLGAFYGPGGLRDATFHHSQHFDLEGLTGRLLSSSYVPEPGEPGYEPMLAACRDLFERYRSGDTVAFEYATRLFWGRLD